MPLGDAQIRSRLLDRIARRNGMAADTVVLQEVGIPTLGVRLDVAVVNGSLHSYEIKSDRDRLDRLPHQACASSLFVDRATLVVGERSLVHAEALIPGWWEIIETSEIGHLRRVRCGHRNPHRDSAALAQLLWCEDAHALLNAHDAMVGFRNKPRELLWARVAELCSVDEIACAVRASLKARPKRLAALRQQ